MVDAVHLIWIKIISFKRSDNISKVNSLNITPSEHCIGFKFSHISDLCIEIAHNNHISINAVLLILGFESFFD